MNADVFSLKKMTWAIDAFERPEGWVSVIDFIKVMVKLSGVSVDPVFVLSPARAHVSPLDVPKWDEAFKALAEKKMAELTRNLGISSLGPGHVLVESSTSTRKMANRLIECARNEGSDIILVATHARKGLSRFFLGSFAETLLTQSPFPVITINPSAHTSNSISHILFPTDFDVLSRSEFEATVELAKKWSARLTLFFKVPPLTAQSYFTDVPGYFYGYSEEEDRNRKSISEEWKSWGNQQGVKTIVELDESPGDVAVAITQFAASNEVSLISLSAHAGPVFAALIGSISRQVIRNAQCPVWVKYSPDWVTVTKSKNHEVQSHTQGQ